jgi:hypothetical protein
VKENPPSARPTTPSTIRRMPTIVAGFIPDGGPG